MRKILVLLSLGLVALTGCKKDSTPSLVENTVLPPATETFAPGAAVTIKGSGFTAADEIWFRAQTKATDDIQATVTKQTATEITFIVPQGLPAGEQTVLLKRDDREMLLGKITVAETTATAKLYGYGGFMFEDYMLLAEVNKATGELTEIVKLPAKISESLDELWGEYMVVNPADGNIYICKRTEGTFALRLDLYRVNPNSKTLDKIGEIMTSRTQQTYYLLIIEGQLHALVEKESDYADHSYSLVSIDMKTAKQTTVADFGSLPPFEGVPGEYLYDKTTHSLILIIDRQLIRLDIDNQEIITGEKFDGELILFQKDGTVCGAFQNAETNINMVDFRTIDTENLTPGESLGSAKSFSENQDPYGDIQSFYTWTYDAATGKAYSVISPEPSEIWTFCAFDFNTKKLEEIKISSPKVWMLGLFQ